MEGDKVMANKEMWNDIYKAYDKILNDKDGMVNRIDLKQHGVIVYSVPPKVIRIDIKKVQYERLL